MLPDVVCGDVLAIVVDKRLVVDSVDRSDELLNVLVDASEADLLEVD